MMDAGWLVSAAPIAAGVVVGLAARKLIADNDRRRAGDDQGPPAAPRSGTPKATRALRPAAQAGTR
jgi:hypothetical protein